MRDLKEEICLLDELLGRSYGPYSGCKVACVLDFGLGRHACGVNVENASYGLTMCAERSAIFNAITSGEDVRECKRVIIKSNSAEFFTPCGACLQVMAEFLSGGVKVVVVNNANKCQCFTLNQLLPHCFNCERLKN